MNVSLAEFAVTALRQFVWLVVLTALFVPLERWFGMRHAQPDRQLRHNLVYYFISSMVPIVLLSAPVALLAAAAQYVVPTALTAAVAELPLMVRVLLAFLVAEIGFYWGHRLSHELPFLWRFHALHHSAERMHFLTNTRSHPVDLVVTRLFGLVPLYLLGLAGTNVEGSGTPALVLVVGIIWGFFIHANLRWRFGPLEWLVTTPAFHHWHHSRRDHINRNYASTLPFLDRLFGSHYLPKHWPTEVGIDEPHPATLGGQLVEPMRPARKAAPVAK